VIALLVAAPFIDRSPERRPWKRPVAMGAYGSVLLGLIALGVISFWQDHHNPAIAKQLQNQRQETQEYMAAPFRPYSVGAVQPITTAASPNPLIQKGQTVFTGQGCNSCHGDGGVGTSIAPSLVGVAAKFPPDKISAIVRNPPPKFAAAGMPSFNLSDDQMKALLEHLDSLK
jgi:mono/diheme cytochrome c family protein